MLPTIFELLNSYLIINFLTSILHVIMLKKHGHDLVKIYFSVLMLTILLIVRHFLSQPNFVCQSSS